MAITTLHSFHEGVQALFERSPRQVLLVGNQFVNAGFIQTLQEAVAQQAAVSIITPESFTMPLRQIGATVYRYEGPITQRDFFAVADGDSVVFNEAFLGDQLPDSPVFLQGNCADFPDVVDDLLAQFDALRQECRAPAEVSDSHALMQDPFVLFYRHKISQLILQADELEEKKMDLEMTILSFDQEIVRRLGGLILEKLGLEKELADLNLKYRKDEEDIHRAKSAHEAYRNAHEKLEMEAEGSRVKLDRDEMLQLKTLYRKTMAKTHPDKFPHDEEKREQAEALAAQLNAAYRRRDLAQVRAIHDSVERAQIYVDIGEVSNREELEQFYQRLKLDCEHTVVRIRAIKSTEAYAKIKQYWPDYMNEYIAEMQSLLVQEINQLTSAIKTLKDETGKNLV